MVDLKVTLSQHSRVGEVDFENIPFGKILTDHMVSADYIDLARSFGASRLQMYRTVILPSATPGIFDGLRISAAYALGSAAVAEQIGGARSGLGLLIARAQRNSQADLVLAGVVVIAALSVLIYMAVGMIARRLTPYAEAA